MSVTRGYTVEALAIAGGLTPQSIKRRVAKGDLPPPNADGLFGQNAYDIILRTRRIHQQKDEQSARLRRARARVALANVRELRDRIAALEARAVPRAPVLAAVAARADAVTAELAGLPSRNTALVQELLSVDQAKADRILHWVVVLVNRAMADLKVAAVQGIEQL
jgi:hypothetical protein